MSLQGYFPYLPTASEEALRAEYERRKQAEMQDFNLTEDEWHKLIKGDISVVAEKPNAKNCYALCFASGHVTPWKFLKDESLQQAFELTVRNNWKDGVQHLLAKGGITSKSVSDAIEATKSRNPDLAAFLIEHQVRQMQEDGPTARSRSKSLSGKKK